jgi:DNA-binding MarR family transcriptional regulator
MVMMPRAIDEDLTRRSGIGLTRYVVLMRLSEAPEQALRMSDLADAVAISPSRMTRIVQSMDAEGLVTRQPAPGDGRASLAILTGKGLRRLQEAWPAHLAGVRALVMDHIDPADEPDLDRITQRLLQAIEVSPGFREGQPCPDENRRDAETGAA